MPAESPNTAYTKKASWALAKAFDNNWDTYFMNY